jgi:lysozyme
MGKFQHKLTLPAILFLLLLTCAALLFGWRNFKQETSLPPNLAQAVIGVELNQNQASVDLHQLENNGISFVYLRSTQGRSYFDDDYLSYRDQLQGTKLAFGSILNYSSQSTAQQQYRYFRRKVGRNAGSLPILIRPATGSYDQHDLRVMSQLVRLLQQHQYQAMVEVGNQYRQQFPAGTMFMSTGNQAPNRVQYAFWRYTTRGKVKHVKALQGQTTMYAYNGTNAQYQKKYGRLTQ